MRLWMALAALLGMMFAGCVQDDAGEAPLRQVDETGRILHDTVERAIADPIVVEHDHNDVSQHTGHHNVEFVSWSTLEVELGENGFANFVFWESEDRSEELAFVAIDGDTQGGFAIVDVADPHNLTVLGKYWVDGNSIQEVRVSPDGRFAVMNVQAFPQEADPADADGLTDCTVCIHVVDVRDRANPELVSVQPVELIGTHNFHFEEYSDGTYLFYVGQPIYLAFPDPGDHITIARLETTPEGAHLVPVSTFMYNEPGHPPRSFPHDVLVQDHPDGRKIAYVSYWDAGAVTFDVTDPMQPRMLDVLDDPAPSAALAIHWVMQEQQQRADGRTIAWSAPEIGVLESGTGVIRAMDVTDPTAMEQIGTWELPGSPWIPGQYIFSGHTTVPDMERGLLAVSHYHAGVWILDITEPEDPRHLGYYLPHGDPEEPYDGPIWWKKPNFNPEGYGPNVYQARWKDDLLWVTDRGSGVYVLDYTGPVPGPLV